MTCIQLFTYKPMNSLNLCVDSFKHVSQVTKEAMAWSGSRLEDMAKIVIIQNFYVQWLRSWGPACKNLIINE